MVPDLTTDPSAFSTILLSPPFLLPGVVLALRSAEPICRYASYHFISAISFWATVSSAALATNCPMASRTSVTSEKKTVPPARTIRSAAKPATGLPVSPEKASLPPHCMPTTRSATGQVSRLRALSFSRCILAVSIAASTISWNPANASS